MNKQIPYYDIIEQPEWRTASAAPVATAAGSNLASDFRNDIDGDPNIYYVMSATGLYKYNTFTDGWVQMQSPQLSSFGAGCDSVMHPSAGPRGLISAATATTVTIGKSVSVTATANTNTIVTTGGQFVGLKQGMNVVGAGLPVGTYIQTLTDTNNIVLSDIYSGATGTVSFSFGCLVSPVAVNQLANRGDDTGFKIRIIDNASGSATGYIRERFIIGNTAGVTPTITIGNADGSAATLDFTPTANSYYEILSGNLYMLGGFPTQAITVGAIAIPGLVPGTFVSSASCVGTIGSNVLVSNTGFFTAANLVQVGQMVQGPGIPMWTYVSSISDSGHIVMSQNFLGLPAGYNNAGTATFTATFWVATTYTVATASRNTTTVTITHAQTHQVTTATCPYITILSSTEPTIPVGTYLLATATTNTFTFATSQSTGSLTNISLTYSFGVGAGGFVCTTNGTTAVTSSALFGAVGTGVLPGMSVEGAGVPWGTTVLSKADNSNIVTSNAMSTSGSNYLIFGRNVITGVPGAGTFANVMVGDAVTVSTGTQSILPGTYVTQIQNYPTTPTIASYNGNAQFLFLNQPMFNVGGTALTFSFINNTSTTAIGTSAVIGAPYAATSAGVTGVSAGQSFVSPLFPTGTKIQKALTTSSFALTGNAIPYGTLAISNITKSGSTTTITTAIDHGLLNSAVIHVTVSSNAAALPLGTYTITYIGLNSFSITTNATAQALADTATIAIPFITAGTFTKIASATTAYFNISGHKLATGNTMTCSLTATTSFVLGSTYTVTVLDANNFFLTCAAGGGETTSTASFYIGNTNTIVTRVQGGGFSTYSQAANDVLPRPSPVQNVGLASIANDGQLMSLSECHVPYNRKPGEGFIGGGATYDTGTYLKTSLLASDTSANSITGQPADADSALNANEYRNFQIRIVEDTVNQTAVGQRGRIASHTGGASPVYTLYSNWGVTPSSGAKYVIENDDDKILYFAAGYPQVFCYSISGKTWDTTTFAWRQYPQLLNIPVTPASQFYDLSDGNTSALALGNVFYGPNVTNFTVSAGTYVLDVTSASRITISASITSATNATLWYSQAIPGIGLMNIHPFGLARNSKTPHSLLYCFRGFATPVLDTFNIAGASNGSWTINAPYGNEAQISNTLLTTIYGAAFTTGSCAVYAPGTNIGMFAFINLNATQQIFKFDVLNSKLIPFEYFKFSQGTALAGSRMEVQTAVDPTNLSQKYSSLYLVASTGTVMQSLLLK